MKIVFLLWLISPVSRGSLGSSLLYRKLVHPNLMKREDEIDRWIAKLQEQGYNTAVRLGSRAFQYVTNLVMQTAIRVRVSFLEVLLCLVIVLICRMMEKLTALYFEF